MPSSFLQDKITLGKSTLATLDFFSRRGVFSNMYDACFAVARV